MATNPFDQFGKKVALRALEPSGRTAAQHEILAGAHQADLWHSPDPSRQAERDRLGLLGRLASVPCLVELFSSTPGEDKILDCVAKLITFRQQLRREAARGRRALQRVGSAPPFHKPFLWIITAGRPSLGIAMLGATPAKGWPPGVYLTPAVKSRRRPGIRGMPGGLRVGFVVASELPRERDTILVRLIAGGTALAAAVADLAALPPDADERIIASAYVVELRHMLGHKPRKTKEEEAFIVSTQDAFVQLQQEAHRKGRRLGRTEANARAVLTVLRVRGIAVPDAVSKQILAQKDPARLERWLEKAAIAASLADVLDEPSRATPPGG